MMKITFGPENDHLQGTFRLSAGDLVLALSVTCVLVIAATVLLSGLLDERTAQDILAVSR